MTPRELRNVREMKPPPTMDEAVDRLSALLMEENTALEAMDFARAGGLLAAKHAAADALAAAWRAAEPTHAVTDKMRALGELAEENRQLLKRAMRVQRRVLDLVAKAARTSPRGSRYASGGRLAEAPPSAQSLKTRV
jgi:hypothetical protein